MSNEEYFHKIKNSFESLKNYNIDGNLLTFYDESNNITYKTILQINLSNLNTSLFLLKPRDIFRILYMLELLQKDNNNEQEIQFVKDFVSKYLKLENERLNNEVVDDNLIHNMQLPILLIDDPRPEIQNNIKNTEAKEIVQNLLNEHIENTGRGGEALVLRTKYFKEQEKDDLIDPSSKAGFTSIILIVLTIITTIMYIALFLNK